MNDDWILIEGEIDLRDDDLRDVEEDSPDSFAPSQVEPGPPTPVERREGTLGGAERKG